MVILPGYFSSNLFRSSILRSKICSKRIAKQFFTYRRLPAAPKISLRYVTKENHTNLLLDCLILIIKSLEKQWLKSPIFGLTEGNLQLNIVLFKKMKMQNCKRKANRAQQTGEWKGEHLASHRLLPLSTLTKRTFPVLPAIEDLEEINWRKIALEKNNILLLKKLDRSGMAC